MARTRIALGASLLLAAGLTTVAPSAQAAKSGTARTRAAAPSATKAHHPDFNRDGYADLIITAQNDNVDSALQAGGFWVVYGGAHGANTGNRHKYFTEKSIGRGATSVTGDGFGFSYTTGDFNGDGYDDAAVSADTKTVAAKSGAGAVVVLYGSASGLITTNAQFFTEATSGMGATPEVQDYFGYALAAGDFNRDGRDDLAIGAFGKAISGATRAGMVFELFGTASGLSHAAPLAPRHFHALMPGFHGGAKQNDEFGVALSAADFNGDRYDDLAISAAGKTVGGHTYAGAFHVMPGSAGGLSTTGVQTWTEDTSGVPDGSENGDYFGYTFGALDINGDGRSELVVGAPGESQGSTLGVGAATLFMGTSNGLTPNGGAFYLVSNTTFGQSPEQYDNFGSSFAPFDFDGDGRMDLAIGVEGRDLPSHASAGEVVVLHNVGGRLSRSGGFTLTRSTSGMIGPAGTSEYFGSLVRAGDWSGNGVDDLAVSLPYLTVSGHPDAGAMQVFYGTPSGLGTNDQLFTANTLGGTPYDNVFLGGYDW